MGRRKEPDPVALRFAELAVRVWKRDRSVFADLQRIVPRSNELQESEDGIVGKGPNDMSVGLPYGLEPPNALVMIGFLYAGMMWPFLPWYREAWEIANRMWREEVKTRKQARG